MSNVDPINLLVSKLEYLETKEDGDTREQREKEKKTRKSLSKSHPLGKFAKH